MGYDVSSARDGDEALEIVRNAFPAVVFPDPMIRRTEMVGGRGLEPLTSTMSR